MKIYYTIKVLIIFIFCLPNVVSAQFNIVVTNAKLFPDSISNNIFVAGNFNGWQPADSSTQLFWVDGQLMVTIQVPATTKYLEYKFTCGSWAKGEVKTNGAPQANRTKLYKPGLRVEEEIESFAHIAPVWKPEANLEVIQFKVYSNELKKEKNIRIYLPCNYKNSGLQYPVLYMLDGQNLFDETSSYSGEWGVDESMDAVCGLKKLPAIIVGIDHAGDERIAEYSPYLITEYVTEPMGEAFADFVVNTLKPIIDSMYRTLPQREFTGIAGSSMGGVESMYIVVKYNDVFSKAGVFSPAFWTSENNYSYVEESVIDKPTQIYFLAGALEGENFEAVTDTKKMIDVLLNQNNHNINTRFIIQSTGRHTESFWQDEFFEMFEWLFLN